MRWSWLIIVVLLIWILAPDRRETECRSIFSADKKVGSVCVSGAIKYWSYWTVEPLDIRRDE